MPLGVDDTLSDVVLHLGHLRITFLKMEQPSRGGSSAHVLFGVHVLRQMPALLEGHQRPEVRICLVREGLARCQAVLRFALDRRGVQVRIQPPIQR